MTTTIWKSFRLALPEFPQFGDQIDTPPKDSGSTTAQCTPPRCGIRIPIQHWFDLASRLCLEIHSEQLKTKYLPEIDNFIAFKSEADVVNASTLYLTNPVHAAYQLVHQGDHHLDELIRPPKDTTPSSRCDRAYFSGRPNNEKRPGNSTNVFAVLEYKKFEGLSRDEFDRGIVPNYDRYARAMEDPLFDHSDAKVQTVLRQATHYATIFKTPFVALCDYNTLILLVMTKVGQFQGGEYTYLTIVRDSKMMRKAFLGFLLAAKLYHQSDPETVSEWRKSRTGEDVFTKGEEWEQTLKKQKLKLQPEDPKKDTKRDSRNPDPTHVAPGSQESIPSAG